MFGYYNWILVNFILNITKWPGFNVTSSKPRENHRTCVPFANLVESKIWKGRTLCLNYSQQVLFFLSLALTVEFDAGLVDLIALQFCFLPPLNQSCKKRPGFINQFAVVVVVVQWKATRCRIHLRPVMVCYGLAKVLGGVKALQTRKESANRFENLLCKDLQAILKIFKVNFVVVVVT